MLQRILQIMFVLSIFYLSTAVSTANAATCQTNTCIGPNQYLRCTCPTGYTLVGDSCQAGYAKCVFTGAATSVTNAATSVTNDVTNAVTNAVTSAAPTVVTNAVTNTATSAATSVTNTPTAVVRRSYGNTYYYPTSYSFTTNYNVPGCYQGSLVSSTGSQMTTPPVNSVFSYDANNAIWLLTAPNAPHYNPTTDYTFISNRNTYIGGDECLADTSPLHTTISYGTQVTYTNTNPASASLVNWQVAGASAPSITNYGFSPMVDSQISSNFQTDTYIFNPIPPSAQHDIWTWNAKFANFNNAQQPYASSPVSLSGLPYDEYPTYNGVLLECRYTYDYAEQTTLNSISNYVIPMNVVTGTDGNGNYLYASFNTPILPYILYDFSLPSTGSTPMSQSYDTFGPWTYHTPANSIDTFPVNTPSKFYISYNGVLASSDTPSNLIGSIGQIISGMVNNNGMNNIFNIVGGQKTPAVANPISITASPNDYVYVLNQSTSNYDYYLTVLRLIPHGYYNTTNYPPTSIGQASSNTEWFSNWNTYWQNVISMQNNETYVVDSIDLSQQLGGAFVPLNISADNNGDVFVSGYETGACSNIYCPWVAEVANTISGQITYSSNEIDVPGDSMNSGNFILPEIAASPSGLQLYLANQSDGHIFVYSGLNSMLLGTIDLAYNQNQGEGTSLVTTASLNIANYLANNGLYNQSMPWVSDYTSSHLTEVLDRFGYHHPAAIYDVNGYLYVLDNWAGGIGVGLSGCPSITNPFGVCDDTGVYFDLLMLRVINSTGTNIPINPAAFNDVYQVQQCSVSGISSTSNPNKCIASNIGTSTGPIGSCGPAGECEWTSSSCQTGCTSGGFRQGSSCISGTSYSCESIANTKSGSYISLAPSYASGVYPPYGWVLSANVTAARLQALRGNVGFTTTDVYAYTPDEGGKIFDTVSFNSGSPPPSNYHGVYQPIGPAVYAWSTASVKSFSFGAKYANRAMANPSYTNDLYTFAPYLYTSGMTVNFNNSVDLLFPMLPNTFSSSITVNECPSLWTCHQKNANQYAEMALTRVNIENYTKLFGGNPPYSCLTYYSASSPNPGAAEGCISSDALQYMSPPLYTVTNPFGYLESLGTPLISSLTTQLYSSALGVGSTVGGQNAESCAQAFESANGQSACQTENLADVENAISSGSAGVNNPGTVVTNPLLLEETLYSAFSGNVLVPYTYTYTIGQQWYNWQASSSNNALCGSAPPDSSTSGTSTQYTDAIVSSSSNLLDTPIEGGYVYAKYFDNRYYIPNLSDMGAILPPQLGFALQASRTVDNFYVNLTLSRSGKSNEQYILNATHQLNYYITTYSQMSIMNLQSGYPAFEVINSIPLTTPEYAQQAYLDDIAKAGSSTVSTGTPASCLIGAPPGYCGFSKCSGGYTCGNGNGRYVTKTSNNRCAVGGSGYEVGSCIPPTSSASNPLNNFCSPPSNSIALSYSYGLMPSAVTLFTWYKLLPYDNPAVLYLNGSACYLNGNYKTLMGYNRYTYVYQDKFNNTIYMPLDADIANITTINLNVSHVLSPANANQTLLWLNGTAGYYYDYGTKFKPLENGNIYFYYDNNINYVGYNALLYPNNAILCALGYNGIGGTGFVPQGCGSLSNPIYTGLTQNANVATYAPMFNPSGACYAPANSLLAEPTQLCNIYGSDVIIASNGKTASPVTCGTNSYTAPNGQVVTAQEFCMPDAALPNEPAGTGVCTSQVGLIGTATTNSNGAFSMNTVACGTGSATIIANYYGTPPPEPTAATQVPLGYSANPASTNFQPFPVVNYYWSPNQSAESVPIGFLELSYGDIGLYAIMLTVASVIAVAMLLRRKR